MRLLPKLVLSQARLHPARMALTSLAMIASACMVVWVVSGYDALVSQFDEFSSQYLGRYDLIVAPDAKAGPGMAPGQPGPLPALPADLAAALRADPDVDAADPVLQARVMVVRADAAGDLPTGGGRGMGGPGGSGRRGGGGPGGRGTGPSTQPGTGPTTRASTQPGGARTGPPGPGRGATGPSLVGTNAREPPYPLSKGVWIASAADRHEGAISSTAATSLKVDVGDEVLVGSRGGERQKVKIVGIVEQPAPPGGGGRRGPAGPARGPATSALYVPIALAEKITGQPAQANFIHVALKEGTDAQKFRATWTKKLLAGNDPASLIAAEDVKSGMEEGGQANSARGQAYAATGIAMLAALFIIFTTLSMGVSERIRQFAVLRAVALTRAQVALLIMGESLILGLIGWAGGLAAGWGLLTVNAKYDFAGWLTRLFEGTAPPPPMAGMQVAAPAAAAAAPAPVFGIWTILLAGACAFGGALLASIIPAWRATRVSPLDAMAGSQATPPSAWPRVAVVVGLLLVAVNPLLVFVIPMKDEQRYGIYAAVGCTSMAIGFVLLAPLAIGVAERLFGPLLAKVLRLDPRLLTTQLSANLWRTIGTTVALTIGLGLYAAMQIWGYSMLAPFVPGKWVPEMMVAVMPGGLPDDQTEAVRHIPGVLPDQCLPLAVEQPKLTDDPTHSVERSSVARQDNVVLIGMDPDRGLGGASPLLDLTFVLGTRASAVEQLKRGNHCVVPDHFARETGLGLGGKFRLTPPNAPEKPVEYTIAGVVRLPGWHWMTKFSGVRTNSGRSAAMVFTSFDSVRKDFGISRTTFFWLNTDKSVKPPPLTSAERKELADAGRPLPTEDGLRARMIESSVRAIAERSTGEKFEVAQFGFPSMGPAGPSVRVTTADTVRQRIGTRADGWIWEMSKLPLVTLAVTSLGVINTVLASVRARRWNLGVLRAVGFTRFSVTRMIVAEAILVGLVACILSLAFGLMAGWCGAGISQYVSFFGGLRPPVVVPWRQLSLGFGATLLLCIAAALWPAISTGRAEPLRLLQAGRAAT